MISFSGTKCKLSQILDVSMVKMGYFWKNTENTPFWPFLRNVKNLWELTVKSPPKVCRFEGVKKRLTTILGGDLFPLRDFWYPKIKANDNPWGGDRRQSLGGGLYCTLRYRKNIIYGFGDVLQMRLEKALDPNFVEKNRKLIILAPNC